MKYAALYLSKAVNAKPNAFMIEKGHFQESVNSLEEIFPNSKNTS